MKCSSRLIIISQLISFITFSVLLFSCNFNGKIHPRNKNLWIGQYTDEVFKIPNPTIYANDSIYILSDSIIKIKKQDDLVVSSINDSILRISKKSSDSIGAYFIQARKTDFTFNLSFLTETNWETVEKEDNESLEKLKIYSFNKKNTLSIQTKYKFHNEVIYSEVENFKYKLLNLDSVNVLFIYNDNRYSYSGQIISKNTNSFIIEFLNKLNPNRVEFKSFGQNNHLGESFQFNVCKEHQILQYYNNDSGTTFDGSLRKIKTIFNNKFTYITNETNQNGYIRIRFIVNCEGKIGRFSIMELDENYLPFSYDPKIVISLFKIIKKELNDGWVPGTFSRDNPTQCDNYKHLTFKIKEGKIIDILP